MTTRKRKSTELSDELEVHETRENILVQSKKSKLSKLSTLSIQSTETIVPTFNSLSDDVLKIIFSYIEIVRFSNSYEYDKHVANGAITSQRMFDCTIPNFNIMFLSKALYKQFCEFIRTTIIDKLKQKHFMANPKVPIMYYIYQSFLGKNMSHIQLMRVLSQNRCVCCGKIDNSDFTLFVKINNKISKEYKSKKYHIDVNACTNCKWNFTNIPFDIYHKNKIKKINSIFRKHIRDSRPDNNLMLYDTCILLSSSDKTDHYSLCTTELNNFMTQNLTDNLDKLFTSQQLINEFKKHVPEFSFKKTISINFTRVGTSKYLLLYKFYQHLNKNHNTIDCQLKDISIDHYNRIIRNHIWRGIKSTPIGINEKISRYFIHNMTRSTLVNIIYSHHYKTIYKFPPVILKTYSHLNKFQESLKSEFCKFLTHIEYGDVNSPLILFNKIYNEHYNGICVTYLKSFVDTSIKELNSKLHTCHVYNLFISKLITNVNRIKNNNNLQCKCTNIIFNELNNIINSTNNLIIESIKYNHLPINRNNSYLHEKYGLRSYLIHNNLGLQRLFSLVCSLIYLKYTAAIICKYKNLSLSMLLIKIIRSAQNKEKYKKYYETSEFENDVFTLDSKIITCKISLIPIKDYQVCDILYISHYVHKYVSNKYPEDTDLIPFPYVNLDKWCEIHVNSSVE